MGQIRSGTKADLVTCFTEICNLSVEKPSQLDATVLDGPVIVQMLQPKAVSTFEEYFSAMFAPYISRQLENVQRLDIVWDVYRDDSLKKAARERRGSGKISINN